MSAHLATFLFLGYVTSLAYVALLIAASAATAFTNLVLDRGRWRIGVFVGPRLALRDFAIGASLAMFCVFVADVLVSPQHAVGGGFPWREVWIVYVPAAIQEELVFRGIVFQKARSWNRTIAIAMSAMVFATMHTMNGDITLIAVANLFIAGVLLALAYEVYERLWLPIAFHLAWNVVSGPILGYGVSGYTTASTVFTTKIHGPAWLTGGAFGLEGSIFATAVELAAVSMLLWLRKRRPV